LNTPAWIMNERIEKDSVGGPTTKRRRTLLVQVKCPVGGGPYIKKLEGPFNRTSERDCCLGTVDTIGPWNRTCHSQRAVLPAEKKAVDAVGPVGQNITTTGVGKGKGAGFMAASRGRYLAQKPMKKPQWLGLTGKNTESTLVSTRRGVTQGGRAVKETDI